MLHCRQWDHLEGKTVTRISEQNQLQGKIKDDEWKMRILTLARLPNSTYGDLLDFISAIARLTSTRLLSSYEGIDVAGEES